MPPPSFFMFDNNLCRQESEDDDWFEFRGLQSENPNLLAKKESPKSEKQILVDPISIRSSSASSSMRKDSFNMVLPRAMLPPRDSAVPLPLPPQQPVKPKKKLKKEKLKRQESYMSLKNHNRCNDPYEMEHQGSFLSRSESSKSYNTRISIDSYEEEFRCKAFCMHFTGFGKAKALKPSKRVDLVDKKMIRSMSRNTSISTRVSLEKFECGSWVLMDELGFDSGTHFFDLPVETIKGGGDVQTPESSGFVFHKEAVVVKGVLKTSSSKYSRRTSAGSSPRRIHFSTSSSSISCPTSPRSCTTPPLRKGKADFNAFLDAHKVQRFDKKC